MRIKVLLESENDLTFPKDYRRYFMSFLKKAFEKAGFLDEIFGEKKYRPYVFSVWFGENFKIDEKVRAGNKISFFFSSGDPLVITNFYDGVLKLKDERHKLIKECFEIKEIRLLSYKKITSNKATFKTMGICVLNNPQGLKKDFKAWYVTPNDDLELFNEILYQRTNDRFRYVTGKNVTHFIKLNLIEGRQLKEVIAKHYNGNVRGFSGTFELEGSPEILQFVYDYGLGVRTGQGFGLIELVNGC